MQKYHYCVYIFLLFNVFSAHISRCAAARPTPSPKPHFALAITSRPSSPIDITSPLSARRMLQRSAPGNCIPRTCSHISLPKVEKSSPVLMAASMILPPINTATARLVRTNSAPKSFKPGQLTKDDSPLSLSRSLSRSSEPTSSDSDDDSDTD